MISAKTTGPWEEMIKKLRYGRHWLFNTMEEPLWAMGWALQEELRRRIMKGRGPNPRLLPQTVLRKRFKGAPDPVHTWYEMGYLVENGLKQPQVIATGGDTKSLLVLVSEGKHPKSSKSYAELFDYLEYGSPGGRQKARPVFRSLMYDLSKGKLPAFQKFREQFLNNIKTYFKK